MRIKSEREALQDLYANRIVPKREGTVMRDALDDQIDFFEAHLPGIRSKYGSVWAIVADQEVVETFAEFPDAARYANDHFGKREVLIRHTDEQRSEMAPFVLAHTED